MKLKLFVTMMLGAAALPALAVEGIKLPKPVPPCGDFIQCPKEPRFEALQAKEKPEKKEIFNPDPKPRPDVRSGINERVS